MENIRILLTMITLAALTKLIWLLGKNLSHAQICTQMSSSLRGEITEIAQTLFQHPGLPPKLEALSRLSYAISDNDLPAAERVLSNEKDWLLNEIDYAGGTPLVRLFLNGDCR